LASPSTRPRSARGTTICDFRRRVRQRRGRAAAWPGASAAGTDELRSGDGGTQEDGAGNLFTVFGEPDIEVKSNGDDLQVILRGVDVYDPNTGELRSNDTDR
jgi:hypothetical protein